MIVKTSAPGRLFQGLPVEVISFEADTGMVQLDSLRLDGEESIRRAAAFHDQFAPASRG